MVARDLPTAIVTGIRGNFRHLRIMCRGEAGHSGVVPRWLRHDSVFAASELISNLDEHWRVLLEHGHDLVVTVGTIETDAEHHSVSRIPRSASPGCAWWRAGNRNWNGCRRTSIAKAAGPGSTPPT